MSPGGRRCSRGRCGARSGGERTGLHSATVEIRQRLIIIKNRIEKELIIKFE